MSKENDYDSEDDDLPELDSVSSSEVRWCVCDKVYWYEMICHALYSGIMEMFVIFTMNYLHTSHSFL